MLKIIVSGCCGYMGRAVASLVKTDDSCQITAGIDKVDAEFEFPVYRALSEYSGAADVIIDFSHPSALYDLLDYAVRKKRPIVLCTTGHTPEQIELVRKTSGTIPIFRSGNMSLGINVIADLIQRAANVLGTGYDIEILERHHRRKIDAPSGTALMLADAVKCALPYEPEYVFERESKRRPRSSSEIGISAIRGGTIVGEHEVIFAGADEVIEIRHTAQSRDVFAFGALRAAKFMSKVSAPGLYNMTDLVRGGSVV